MSIAELNFYLESAPLHGGGESCPSHVDLPHLPFSGRSVSNWWWKWRWRWSGYGRWDRFGSGSSFPPFFWAVPRPFQNIVASISLARFVFPCLWSHRVLLICTDECPSPQLSAHQAAPLGSVGRFWEDTASHLSSWRLRITSLPTNSRPAPIY